MSERELSFGDLRAATERALEEPARVDAVVWCILRAPEGERVKMLEYATQKLRAVSVGRVDLSDVVRFTVECERWLLEHLGATQDAHIAESELPRRLLIDEHAQAWCAGLAWLTVRRRGHLEWPGPAVRHWIARVDPAKGYWFGMGLHEGSELWLYQGKEDKKQTEDATYLIRHCLIPEGDPWRPEEMPGWPDSLNGPDPGLDDDDDWEEFDDEDYDA